MWEEKIFWSHTFFFLIFCLCESIGRSNVMIFLRYGTLYWKNRLVVQIFNWFACSFLNSHLIKLTTRFFLFFFACASYVMMHNFSLSRGTYPWLLQQVSLISRYQKSCMFFCFLVNPVNNHLVKYYAAQLDKIYTQNNIFFAATLIFLLILNLYKFGGALLFSIKSDWESFTLKVKFFYL